MARLACCLSAAAFSSSLHILVVVIGAAIFRVVLPLLVLTCLVTLLGSSTRDSNSSSLLGLRRLAVGMRASSSDVLDASCRYRIILTTAADV